MLFRILSMFGVIKCLSSQNNFLKKWWRGQNFGIIFWEIEPKKKKKKVLYNKQSNYCLPLLRTSMSGYKENLNIKNVTDDKRFWKSVKPLLSFQTNLA